MPEGSAATGWPGRGRLATTGATTGATSAGTESAAEASSAEVAPMTMSSMMAAMVTHWPGATSNSQLSRQGRSAWAGLMSEMSLATDLTSGVSYDKAMTTTTSCFMQAGRYQQVLFLMSLQQPHMAGRLG